MKTALCIIMALHVAGSLSGGRGLAAVSWADRRGTHERETSPSDME